MQNRCFFSIAAGARAPLPAVIPFMMPSLEVQTACEVQNWVVSSSQQHPVEHLSASLT